MNYFQFHIGDYSTHTRHLSLYEDLAYRRMLDLYYTHEKPLPLDAAKIARLIGMRDHVDEVVTVLADFFTESESGYHNARADSEIAAYQGYLEKQAQNGKKGGRPKNPPLLSGNPPLNDGIPTANPNPTQDEPKKSLTTNHYPLTTNQEPISIPYEPNGSLSPAIADDPIEPVAKAPKAPACPQKEIIALWAKHLPNLTQPRSWEGARQTNMRNRWLQASKKSDYSPDGYRTTAEGIKWWDSFFGYIANETKLAHGFDSAGRNWKPDLEWVVNAANFQKIVDGKYGRNAK
jgi:uncharacterized protein YdaU (DUF1376 family)